MIVGRTSATNFPGAENNNSGGADGFMLALGDNLALMNSRYVGGAGDDSLVSITAGYVAGSTDSGILEGRASLGGRDAFVGGYQLDSGGRVQFKMFDRLGGSGDDSAVVLKEYSRMAPDPEAPFLKELMLAGTTNSDHLSGASRASFGGATDGFYVRLRPEDSGLRVVESNYVGGSGRDSVADISVTFFLSRADPATPVPFWSKQYQRRVPANAPGGEAQVAALSAAFGDITAELARDLAALPLQKP